MTKTTCGRRAIMPKRKVKFQSPVDVLAKWDDLPRDEKYSANARKFAKMAGMKSIAEIRCAAWLIRNNVKYDYESEKWTYQYEPAHYTPDFVLPGRDFVIEVKGKMTKDVRKKLLAIQKSNPSKKVFVVFERAKNKIASGSKTTYGTWADKHNFTYGDVIPEEVWFHDTKRKRKTNST
jgi:hypothetical protein